MVGKHIIGSVYLKDDAYSEKNVVFIKIKLSELQFAREPQILMARMKKEISTTEHVWVMTFFRIVQNSLI